MTSSPALVLVPVKSFARAKGRLAEVMHHAARRDLAIAMAQVVLDAAAPLGAVVVCDDDEVAEWARDRGAAVAWTPALDLNGALRSAATRAAAAEVDRVIIAHADLPFASALDRFAQAAPDEVLIVADRHDDGTNVMSLPTEPMMDLHYGAGSLAAHRRAARDLGLTVTEVFDEALAWDVDLPGDLDPPEHLGSLPSRIAGSQTR